jgi:RNA polymerase sigma factor (sigma-70 family)
LRQLIDTLDDGVALADGEGRMVLANRRLAAMFGYAPGELVGQPVEMLVPAAGPGPEDAAVEAETRRRVVTALTGLPDRYRTAVLLKDGLGLPAGQVAAAMCVSVPTVRSVLHRAGRRCGSLAAPASR